MLVFVLIIVTILLGDVAWWWWADRQLRPLRRAPVWRTMLAAFCAVMIGYVLWLILWPESARRAHVWMPMWGLAPVYVWHLLVLPVTLVMVALVASGRAGWRLVREKAPTNEADLAVAAPTRRQVLAAAAVALPPLVTISAAARALGQVHQFRIRRIEIPLAQLPTELDGMTIAHVSDLHVGRFTRSWMLPRIADATNAMKADLVLLTGDLIDLSLVDLPAGLDFVRRLDPRQGLFMCEGNHDLIENRFAFESRVKAAGVPLLLDQSALVRVNGTPVQVLGMSWSRGDRIIESINRLIPQRHSHLFQILLAHHPHAFDPAAALGIPLTLSGHTHGGQLMLNERLGAGPAMFKYFSGLYRQKESALVVSNGVGNWFPLRVNAPAELVHITLRSMQKL